MAKNDTGRTVGRTAGAAVGGAVGGPVGATIGGAIGGSLFGGGGGGGNELKNFEPIGVKAGGLTAKLDRLPGRTRTVTRPVFGRPARAGVSGKDRFAGPRQQVGTQQVDVTERGAEVIDITASPERQRLVGGIRDLLQEQAGEFGELREQVEPGMGELTEARLTAVENARQRSVGNLRENLARRRVLGSSFGQDALTRAESEFAQEEQKARAQSFLEEMELESKLIDREAELQQASINTVLNEMNMQADLATQLATRASGTLAQNAQMQAKLSQQRAAGRGQLLGLGITQLGNLGGGGGGSSAGVGNNVQPVTS